MSTETSKATAKVPKNPAAGSTKTKKKPVSKSSKACIIFPVGRIHTMLKHRVPTKRVSVLASIYLAAILEYLTSEVLELTVSTLKQQQSGVRRISPRHIVLAIKTDEELDQLIKSNTTIAGGGVLPHIHKNLLKNEEKPVTHKKAAKASAK
ncbi:histone H2A [Heterostelium album PN500]|uniref:Histone H2A n=1 Tax=Heterostelium pallidum (strain ATCC 26659 / Pp 5 / PN500) TaxID=670386 RepID=D3BCX0_HETP5|nr:histone H2A [Heterostelium album PN500]EFA80762.1 histone H2A [Heterostelium album PN500]|eukprot:XP_020432881.1 histone H2A [Heterostelium album PN500]